MEPYLKSNSLSISLSQKIETIEIKLPFGFIIGFFFLILSTGFIAYSRRQFNVIIQPELSSQLHCIIVDATGSFTSACLLSSVAIFTYKNPVWRRDTIKTGLTYLLITIIHCILFISLSSFLRHFAFEAFGLEYSKVINWPEVIQTEIPPQIFMLTVTIATIHGLLFFQRSNAEQLRVLRIEQQLAKEKLRSLQGQINPHFLFNTLNTISAMMYENVSSADRMIENLSKLLRASLKLNSMMELSLKDELKLLNAYTSIMKDRFPEKFDILIDSPEQCGDVLVPPLILQPILENCFKHGRLDTLDLLNEKGSIEVKISEENGFLTVTITDNGNSHTQSVSSTISESDSDSSGLGLNLTEKRLRLLYRSKAKVTAGFRKEARGYQVTLVIPARRGEVQRRFSPTPQSLTRM